MKLCKKLWLRHYIKKYERFLSEEGIKESSKREKNIRVGLEYKATINENPFETIYLPQNEKGQTDISPILALGAENHFEEARAYILYNHMLRRMKRQLCSTFSKT